MTAPLLEISSNHLEQIEATKSCRLAPTSSPKTRCRRGKMPFTVKIIADFMGDFLSCIQRLSREKRQLQCSKVAFVVMLPIAILL